MNYRFFKREYSKEKYNGNEKKNDKDREVVAHDNDVDIVNDYISINLACQYSTWIID